VEKGERRIYLKHLKRCQKCREPTLIDIIGEPVQINPFTYRSYIGIECVACHWNKKSYTFTDVEEDK
jgi:hypothetical protein